MFTVEQSVVIQRPVADVFALVGDPRNDAQWRSDVRGSRLLTDGPVGVGSLVQHEIRFLGRQTPIYEVTAHEPEHHVELVGRSGPLRTSIVTYLLEPHGDGATRLLLRFEVQPNGLLRLVESLMQRPFRQQLAAFLSRLQTVLESR